MTAPHGGSTVESSGHVCVSKSHGGTNQQMAILLVVFVFFLAPIPFSLLPKRYRTFQDMRGMCSPDGQRQQE